MKTTPHGLKIDKRKSMTNMLKDNNIKKETKNVGLIRIKKSKLRRLEKGTEEYMKLENEIKRLEVL